MNYYWYTDEDVDFDYTTTVLAIIIILSRSVVIGAKYGTFSDERMDLLREVKLS